MDDIYAGFVDAGFLKAEGARVLKRKPSQVHFDAGQVVSWIRGLYAPNVKPLAVISSLLRVYWYDGALSPSHRNFMGQRSYHETIANVPGIQLRLGQIVERPSKLKAPIQSALRSTANGLDIDAETLVREFNNHWKFFTTAQQKGVDTLMTLDMVRVASRGAFETAIVITGDRDLAEVVRTVQDYGIRVQIATPNKRSVARELLQIADGVREINTSELKKMLPDRPSPN